jgi:hypothetical protein
MSKPDLPTSKFTHTLVIVLLTTLTMCPPTQANLQKRALRVLQQKSQPVPITTSQPAPSPSPSDQSEFEKYSANPEFQLYLKNRPIYTQNITSLYRNFAPQKVYHWEWKPRKNDEKFDCLNVVSDFHCERTLNSLYLRDTNFCKFLLTSDACPAALKLFKKNIGGKIPEKELEKLFPDNLIIELYIQTFMGMYVYYTGDSGWKFTSLNKMLSFY